MTDYDFTPPRMVWRVGERVSLTFLNDSQGHPGRGHEFMMGRMPRAERTPFGITYEHGYERDFFAGVTVSLSRAREVEVVMPGLRG